MLSKFVDIALTADDICSFLKAGYEFVEGAVYKQQINKKEALQDKRRASSFSD